MIATLDSCRRGDAGTVNNVLGDTPVGRRLCEMGLVPGTPFTVVRFAPLGDPIELDVMGARLSLRKADAALVQIDAL